MSDTLECSVVMKVRKATASDLKLDDKTLNYGQPFWLKSMVTGEFMNQPLKIHENTDVDELASWLKNNMIYVPVQWNEKFKEI
ncbi:hypothetical protein [Maribacter sp. Hel_I_7]|uniref:hypothetical protein n=1 Tax=Maribacter sp. Hel_I_7 TaxID=1249997 RepID=UPI00047D9414|nr:hypothetical protein [Maribacter sp. Hel_I_7]